MTERALCMQYDNFEDDVFDIQATFKALRKARGYTQADLADGTVSKSLISKFESGNSMISADKMLHLISKLNMTANEFVAALTHYQPDHMQRLYQTLNQLHFSGLQGVDSAEKLIVEKATDKFDILSNIMIKSALQELTGQHYIYECDRYIVGDYLTDIDNWTEFEVKLLYYVCPILDSGDCRWFGEILIERQSYFYHGVHRRLFILTLIRLYQCLLEHETLDYATFFRDKICQLAFDDHLIATVKFQILRDLHDYINKPTKENVIKVERYLNQVEALGIKSIVDDARARLRRQNEHD